MNRFPQLVLILCTSYVFGQKTFFSAAIEVDLLQGNIIGHSPEMTHLIKGHPSGQIISFTNKTYGEKSWHKLFNYPDYGYYFIHQDYKNIVLGQNYGAGVFFNFYFLKRNLYLKIAQGLAYNTNPADNETNNKNTAFGSSYLFNTNLFIGFKRENIFKNVGFQTGIVFTHFSNGRIKSPNSGINTYNFNFGLNYNIMAIKPKVDTATVLSMKFLEPLRYNFVCRFGINENPIIGSGQKPFYHLGMYVDKRINRKSALQLGSEVFFTLSKKEYIRYRAIAYPETNVDINTDYRRIGVFLGHELFINKLSVETQIGYYVYDPFLFDGRIYDRIGAKYYINKNIFGGLALKTHGFLAEAAEFSIGCRL